MFGSEEEEEEEAIDVKLEEMYHVAMKWNLIGMDFSRGAIPWEERIVKSLLEAETDF